MHAAPHRASSASGGPAAAASVGRALVGIPGSHGRCPPGAQPEHEVEDAGGTLTPRGHAANPAVLAPTDLSHQLNHQGAA